MGEWTRKTKWRQGSILSAKTAVALGLASEDEVKTLVFVAISHDCDIATDNLRVEPKVEFLVGNHIDKIDGSYTRAKNARTLHLEFSNGEGNIAASFSIRERVEIDKTALADHEPDADWSHASPKAVISIRWWLAARYFRSSFPDTFEDRLKQSKLDEKIDKQLSPHGEALYGIFFLVDDGAGDNKDEEPHELRAFVVYDDAESDEGQVAAIKRAVAVIASAFKTKFYDDATATWKGIELVSCGAVSDEIFSFSDSKIFKHWRLDHRSLENDEQKLPVQGA